MPTEVQCIYCDRNSKQVPILTLQFQGDTFWICPQHLPILIHKPEQLADKLPGLKDLPPSEEHH